MKNDQSWIERINNRIATKSNHKSIVKTKRPLQLKTGVKGTVDYKSEPKTYEPKKYTKTVTVPTVDDWDTGLNIIDKPTIEINHKLLAVCDKLQDEFPATEFSILAKGHYSDKGFYVTDEYVVPNQKVGGASVDYEELYIHQKDGFNVVIHSHHNMGTFFSPTDKEYINTHFPCSVLYTRGAFTIATLSFQGGNDAVFLMETKDVHTFIDISNVTVKGIENIEKETYYYQAPVKKGSLAKKDNDDYLLKDKFDNELEEEEDFVVVEYLPDGENVKVNGMIMSIDDYEICEQCDCINPDICKQCFEGIAEVDDTLQDKE